MSGLSLEQLLAALVQKMAEHDAEVVGDHIHHAGQLYRITAQIERVQIKPGGRDANS